MTTDIAVSFYIFSFNVDNGEISHIDERYDEIIS
jgi:hypothetical protein